MDRNFLLPIAVAAGVHSMLFISGTPTALSDIRSVTEPAREKWDVPEDIPLDLLDPPEVTGEAPKESTAKPPPVSQERLTTLPNPDDFIQAAKLEDLRPRPTSDIGTIDREWEKALVEGTRKGTSLFDRLSLDNTPAVRFQPAPTYPHDLKPAGFDGSVTVRFSVDVKGEVFDAVVTNATHTRFGEEALRAVKRWRFEPGIKDGKRVAFRMVQTFSFTLSE